MDVPELLPTGPLCPPPGRPRGCPVIPRRAMPASERTSPDRRRRNPALNVRESNIVLRYFLDIDDAGIGPARPSHVLASAERLAARANRCLMSGLTARRITEAWSTRRGDQGAPERSPEMKWLGRIAAAVSIVSATWIAYEIGDLALTFLACVVVSLGLGWSWEWYRDRKKGARK